MRDIGQIDDAIVKPVLGKPTTPVLDLNVIPVLCFLIRGCPRINHDGKELRGVGLQLLRELECFLHACRRFVQISHHETAVHHDARVLAAPDEPMSLFVVFGVTPVVIVLLHAMNHFHIAALEADTK